MVHKLMKLFASNQDPSLDALLDFKKKYRTVPDDAKRV